MTRRLWLCALLLGVALPASARAQEVRLPHVATGPPQIVVLPKILAAGARATLSVLDAKGVLVPAADVVLSTGARITTDDFGRAAFSAPALTGAFTAKIVETGAIFSTTVLALPKGVAGSPSVACPSLIVLGDRFEVFAGGGEGGGFSGDASLDRVVLGNLPALVLAASPVSLVALPNPSTSAGLTDLSAGLASRKLDPRPVTVVALQLTGPATALAAGEKSSLAVRVDGSTERLGIEVHNLSPQIVAFPRNEVEHLVTSGGPANFATVTLTGIKAGDYSVSARLESHVGEPDIAAAREELLAAQQAADAPLQKRLKRLIQEMDSGREHSPHDAARFRDEVERMVHGNVPEPVARLLELAWQSLSGG